MSFFLFTEILSNKTTLCYLLCFHYSWLLFFIIRKSGKSDQLYQQFLAVSLFVWIVYESIQYFTVTFCKPAALELQKDVFSLLSSKRSSSACAESHCDDLTCDSDLVFNSFYLAGSVKVSRSFFCYCPSSSLSSQIPSVASPSSSSHPFLHLLSVGHLCSLCPCGPSPHCPAEDHF